MADKNPYLFKSARLGFRNWVESDTKPMSEINSDPVVMEFFPGIQTEKQTADFIQRMQQQFEEKGLCYYAIDNLETNEFIGFTGLSEQNYDAEFTPCVDIGWRIKRQEWNKGLATEAAIKCLDYAFEMLKLEKIYAITPTINLKSQRIMQKAGMKMLKTFHHPLLKGYRKIEECIVYEKLMGFGN